jgi:hypothetical protein
VESTNILRYEDDGTQTVVGAWARYPHRVSRLVARIGPRSGTVDLGCSPLGHGAPWFPPGENVQVDGETVSGKMRRSGTPQRVDDYAGGSSDLVKRLRAVGI